jgi:hypothetical protein
MRTRSHVHALTHPHRTLTTHRYIMPYFTKSAEERLEDSMEASQDALNERPRPKSKGPSHAELPLGEGGSKPGSPRPGLEQSAFLKTSKAEDIMLETINLN